MSGGMYGPEGSSPFDEFLARIYGVGGSPRPGQRIDITRLMSGPARQLPGTAAAQAAEYGGADLDTEPLLWAAATVEPTRQLLSRAGADPAALVRGSEKSEQRPGRTGRSPATQRPQLTPGAKRALLDAHQVSRSLGSTYIGPEHIVLALALNPESAAGRMLSARRVTPEALQAALAGSGSGSGSGPGSGSGAGPGQGGGRSATPTLDEFGRDLTALAMQ